MRSETVAVGCHRLPIGLFQPFSALSGVGGDRDCFVIPDVFASAGQRYSGPRAGVERQAIYCDL